MRSVWLAAWAAVGLVGCGLDDRDEGMTRDAAIDAPSVDATVIDAVGGPAIDPATIDAVDDLLAIAHATLAVHDATGSFPAGSLAFVPPIPCCAFPGAVCAVTPEEWREWRGVLGFMPPRPTVRYRYQYQSQEGQVIAVATADLDCDTLEHALVLQCTGTVEGASCHLVWPADFD